VLLQLKNNIGVVVVVEWDRRKGGGVGGRIRKQDCRERFDCVIVLG
jgi:hypothetical protein